jgi:hypothetical protein
MDHDTAYRYTKVQQLQKQERGTQKESDHIIYPCLFTELYF